MTRKPRRTVTEWLLTYFGPAQVGNIRSRRRPVSPAAEARDTQLHQDFVRVVGPDGRPFLVQRDDRS